MKLASLKQKYSDFDKPASASSDEYYPSLYLSDKQLDGLNIDNPRVGTELTMAALVRVASISESKGGSRSVSFEIIEAGFSPKEKQKDAAAVLFPNG